MKTIKKMGIYLLPIIIGLISGYIYIDATKMIEPLIDLVPPPKSAAQLAEDSDLILIGTIETLHKESGFKGYDALGNLLEGKESKHPLETPEKEPHPLIPFTDFVIKADQILKNNESTLNTQKIILRELGSYTNVIRGKERDSKDFPISKIGEKWLLFLNKNPEGTYGLRYGPISRLDINENFVRTSNKDKTRLKLDDQEITTVDLMKVLKKN